MKKAIIFLDIDGTLISEDGKRYLPDSAREAIARARKKGNLVFINTGRVIINVDPFIREVGFDGFVCGCGTYITFHDDVVFKHELESDYCKQIAKINYECGHFSLYEAWDLNSIDGRLKPGKMAYELIEYFKENGRPFLSDVESPDFHFDKFTAWFDEDSDHKRFVEGISDRFAYIDRGPGFCEIVPKGFSKASGIDFLLKKLKISREDSYAFGDSNNDLDMLRFAGHSVVMEKASDSLKSMAEFVTGDVYDDGIYNAFLELDLI